MMAVWDSNAANKGGIWWSEGERGNPDLRKGWKMAGDKRYIQRSMHDGSYIDVDYGLTSLSWAYESVWDAGDYMISYANPTDNALRIKSVTIKCISNNSGGSNFWGAGPRLQPPAYGKAATYHCIIKTYDNYSNYPNTPKQISESAKIQISAMNVSNMIHPGSTSGTAAFAWVDGYSIKKFNFSNQEIVIPGNGLATIQIGVGDFNGQGNGFIQFDLNSQDSPEIESEDLIRPYIWLYDTPKGETANRWHLINPGYIQQQNGIWAPLENILKPPET